MTEPAAGPVRIEFLTRPGCHLCADAREVLRAVAVELGVGWVERDISADPDELRRYADWIPVTLVDGFEHDYWRLSPDRLRAALEAPRR